MTIAARNRLIKTGILLSCLLSLFAAAAFVMLCITPGAGQPENPVRLFSFPDLPVFAYSFYASLSAVLLLAAGSTAAFFRVFFLFEKTPSLEITFFSAGILSVSLESIRLLVPLHNLWDGQDFLVMLLSRGLFFARTFFLLTVLSGAVFSFSKKLQQCGVVLFFLAVLSFLAVRSFPFNNSGPTTLFFMPPGYFSAVQGAYILLGCTAVLSFLIQAKTAHAPEYFRTATGCAFMLSGWEILCFCDNWAFFAGGAVLRFTGTSLYLRSLHKHYLWQ
ncbi:MAG: hypothetical protein IAA96_02685 [Spirochaetes bacterium]|uniref:Uncharacterized protein n=1 Tax=Candidatus Avitreponema avistercoris TaxID=2840705 RepID=A0A9D9ENU7_9SPIR|nr:hypothetical protein [Candidatus Avitreponema avistercoris]